MCIDVAGAYEGLASAAIVLLKHDVSAMPVQRNSSFSLRHELLAATGSLRSELLLALKYLARFCNDMSGAYSTTHIQTLYFT